MRVTWFTNIPVPYKVDFFNELGKKSDLTVIFQGKYNNQNRNWFENKQYKFSSIFLREKEIQENKINWNILKYINKKNQDIVVVASCSNITDILLLLSLKIKRIPYIFEADGAVAKSGKGIKEWLKKFLIGSAECWLSSGEITDEYFLRYGANKEKIFRYPFTSIKSEDILPSPLSNEEKKIIREKLNIKGDKVVISVGQLIHRKGFDILIKAWSKIDSNNSLIIIGDGEKKEEYINLIKKLEVKNIKLIDFKNKEELFEYYKASDFFILPTREDIWGLVINEAMANGLPVITTNKCVAGLELIDNSNGIIIDSEDEIEMTTAINKLLSNKINLNNMATNNINKIKKYSIEVMSELHYEYLKNIYRTKNTI